MATSLFTIYSSYFEVLARVGRRRLFWPAVFAVFLLYVGLPLLSEKTAIETARSSSAFGVALDSLRASVKAAGPNSKEEKLFVYPVSAFAQVSIPYMAYWDTDPTPPQVRSDIGTATVSLRLDQVVLAGAMIIMLALTLSTIYASRSESPAVAAPATSLSATSIQPHTTARQVFAQEVKLAEFRAETLFKRSTYLLTGGVLMAFVGVAVFYATLPDPIRDESQSSYWIRALRATGMLVFLEAIAWFLLRQYRNLIEDFKSFHRIYMKRANYLAAITLIDKDIVRAEDLLLVAALLGEDFSGRLGSGETTEALEGMKAEGTNPVFALVHDALAKAFNRSASTKSATSPDLEK